MGPYSCGLGDLAGADAALAGGKGANLAELIRAGFPVPPGFVVTTTAYRDSIDAAGLAGADPADLYEGIRRASLPEDIATAIRKAYRELGSPAVAVRSSGTAEDLADASFAGQHDTFLNVTGEQAVLAAIRDCWASLWTPRAVAYRQQYGGDGPGLALAVVVQTMVDAEWAGVMFTADPVTGRRDQLVIEAVRGLGDALVSGEAGGHRHVVDKATGRPLVSGSSPSLPAGLLAELAQLGPAVEDSFGRPQDIEWAYAGGRCFLVQARPLTALPDEPTGLPDEPTGLPDEPTGRAERTPEPNSGRSRGRTRGPNFGQALDHVPFPPYPMDVSLALRPALGGLLGWLRSVGFATPELDEVLVEIDDGVVQLVPPRVRPTRRVLRRAPAALPKAVSFLRGRPEQWRARYEETLGSLARRLDREDLAALTEQELIERVLSVQRELGRLFAPRFGCIPRGALADQLLALLLRRSVGAKRADAIHQDLMAAVPSVTRDANRALAGLAATIRRTPQLSRAYEEAPPAEVADRLRGSGAGRAFLEEVAAYLRRYGHRETSMASVGFPALRDTPETLHGLLASLARSTEQGGAGEPGGAGQQGEAGEDEVRFAAARASLAAGNDVRPRFLTGAALKWLDTARNSVGFREDSHYLLFMAFAVMRRVLLELGNRLVGRGALVEAADVFYLELDEVTSLAAGRARETAFRETVSRRRAAREAALDTYTIIPAEFIPSTGNGEVVRGNPASRGTATGPVRIIRDESEFGKLQQGDVLVCGYTNPAWTPLFSVASAAVVDGGGAASHAAIVAREYGIPAVMGTVDGTRLLRDGQQVRVDGEAGIVTPA